MTLVKFCCTEHWHEFVARFAYGLVVIKTSAGERKIPFTSLKKGMALVTPHGTHQTTWFDVAVARHFRN